MSRREIRLKGMTMPELLVTMIIAGILFLSVMDGFRLFYKYTSKVSDKISWNMNLYDSYYSLGELVTGADSMIYTGNKVDVYSGDRRIASLYESDSCIVMEVGARCDTVFSRASFTSPVSGAEGALDSLVVELVYNHENVRFCFQVNTPVEVRLLENANYHEINYRYE